jgi:DNA-binding Lrp family transcriptional regulator
VQGKAEVLEVCRPVRATYARDVVVVVGLLADGRDVFVVSRGDDFLLHVAVPDTDALYAFVIDRLTERREVADVRTSVVYEHIRRPVLEPLGSDTRT